MAISKILYNGVTQMDLTQDSVAAENLLSGETAHGADGLAVIGTMPASSGPVGRSDVNFIDYDGTLVASKTKAEINAMTSDSDLPANPTHTGLTAQGWNWTVAQLKAQLTAMPDQEVWVGQMYITASGATEIDVTFDDPDYLSPYLSIAVNGTVEVDWGDGSSTDTMTDTSDTTLQYKQHVYASIGNYTIRINVESGKFTFYNNYSTYASVLKATNSSNNRLRDESYNSCINAIFLGTNAYIGRGAFYNCYNLKNITIPSSATSIIYNAFYYCCSLQSIIIPPNITSGGSSIFNYCVSLQFISFPYGTMSIGNQQFQYCISLQYITIPSSVTSIGQYAFQSCNSLKNISIPLGASVADSAFANCYSLQNVSILSALTSIENNLFQQCFCLKSITIPSTVTDIKTYAFGECKSLKNIIIPPNVTTIGSQAFYECFAFNSITIPSSVTSIDNSAFSNCYGVLEYHFQSTTPPTFGTNVFNSITSGTVIYVPRSEGQTVLTAYQTATNWSTYASYMQEELAP